MSFWLCSLPVGGWFLSCQSEHRIVPMSCSLGCCICCDVAVQEASCRFKAFLGAFSCPLEYPGIFQPTVHFPAHSIPDGGNLDFASLQLSAPTLVSHCFMVSSHCSRWLGSPWNMITLYLAWLCLLTLGHPSWLRFRDVHPSLSALSQLGRPV